MQEVVQVSNLENLEKLKSYVQELFQKGLFEEINQTIGMHSLFIKPEYARADLLMLLRYVLGLIKNKIKKEHANEYSLWLSDFPKLLTEIAEGNAVVTSKSSAGVLASRLSGHGPFTSVDEFFFWAMEDKRLPLKDTVKYIEKTAEGIK